jgi:hypothetical protein
MELFPKVQLNLLIKQEVALVLVEAAEVVLREFLLIALIYILQQSNLKKQLLHLEV